MASLKSKTRRQRDRRRINAGNYNGETVGCNPPNKSVKPSKAEKGEGDG